MKPKHIQWVLVSVLSVLAFLNIYKSLPLYSHPDSPYDARNVYLAGKLWLNGQNPYDDKLLKEYWNKEAETLGLVSEKPPGFPDCGLIYPFFSIPVLFPYFIFNWSVAKIFIWTFSVLFFLIFVFLSFINFKEHISKLVLMFILLLAFKSSTIAIALGQPALFALAAIMVSWYFYLKEKDIPSGFFLGIAVLKVSLCVPFVIFFLARKKWKLILTSSIIPIMSLMFFYTIGGSFYLEAFLQNISTQMHINYDGKQINAVNTNLTELGILLNYFLNIPYKIINSLNLILLPLGLTLIYYFFYIKHRNVVLFMPLLIIWNLLFSYHLIYDCLLLVFIVPCIKSLDWKWILLLSPLFLPINGLFKNTDWIQFHLPFVLLILFLYLVYDNRYTKQQSGV